MTNKLQTKNYNFLRRGASFCGHFAVLFGCWVRGGNRRLSQTCLFALLLGFEVVELIKRLEKNTPRKIEN